MEIYFSREVTCEMNHEIVSFDTSRGSTLTQCHASKPMWQTNPLWIDVNARLKCMQTHETLSHIHWYSLANAGTEGLPWNQRNHWTGPKNYPNQSQSQNSIHPAGCFPKVPPTPPKTNEFVPKKRNYIFSIGNTSSNQPLIFRGHSLVFQRVQHRLFFVSMVKHVKPSTLARRLQGTKLLAKQITVFNCSNNEEP